MAIVRRVSVRRLYTRFARVVFVLALAVVGIVNLQIGFDRQPTRESFPAVGSEHAVAAQTTETLPNAPTSIPTTQSSLESASFVGNQLLAYVLPPRDASEIEARLAAPTRTLHYVCVNISLFTAKHSPFRGRSGDDRVELPLPDRRSLAIRINSIKTLGPRRFTANGEIVGRKESRALFAYSNGAIAAQIIDPELGEFQLRMVTSADGEVGQFFAVDESRLRACGGSPSPLVSAEILNTISLRSETPADRQISAKGARTLAAENGSDVANIRLLFLYTNAVTVAYGSVDQVQSVIDLSIAGVNADFVNSQIAARIELASAQQVLLSESNLNYSRTLDLLRARTDGALDDIHRLRDEVSADLVALGVNGNDTGGSLGIAYLLEVPNDYLNPFFGFSVVQFGAMSSNNVLSHELGHNFGCAHDRENASGQGAYPYSYGYRFFAQDSNGFTRQFRDIMAYAPGARVPYFSSPRIKISKAEVGSTTVILPVPTAVGIEAGVPGQADNARTIQQSVFEVSNYRASPELPYDRGILVNVSTRAFVGAGFQQLIGGFVVAGSSAKNILIRAAGPALGAFGVSDTLPDPILRVYHAGATNPFAENDNWMEQASTQGATLPGFAFAPGSRDAALLLTLEPGGYTANVEGADGTTGTALVEAYEADRVEGIKLINLSTRAFADRSRPIIAGFVVTIDASEPTRTKRLLIRVLGPTLASFGIEDFMTDPLLQLYNGKNELLLENDDWDPPNTEVDGGLTLIRGRVDQYSEQRVFDVVKGLNIPVMSPVEPAILVDLPSGSYTVLVQPFEDIVLNQPAEPGVAMVEIYEVPAR